LETVDEIVLKKNVTKGHAENIKAGFQTFKKRQEIKSSST
jgi:hypothetical protein